MPRLRCAADGGDGATETMAPCPTSAPLGLLCHRAATVPRRDGDGHPMLVVFSTCVDFIRTVPFLQHDPDRPADVMTDSEDHCGDEGTVCLHVATVGADEGGTEAGEQQRLPALPDGRAAGGLVDVLRLRAL